MPDATRSNQLKPLNENKKLLDKISSEIKKMQNKLENTLMRRDVMIGLFALEESFLFTKALPPYKIPESKDNR
jgi:hypothetical protein